MSDAVFSLSAEIVPQINEREAERQAQQLASQLNNILAKNITGIKINPVTGSFRPFEKEVVNTQGVLDKLQGGLGVIPRTLGNIGKAGKGAFLKFTDAINLTRRDMVGFGGSVFDTIRDTDRFKDSLDGIKDAGGALQDLPQRFEILAAQIESGTSLIDRFAKGGNQMALMFQPLQREGEASRVELVELNRTLDMLVGAMANLGANSGKTGSVIKAQFGQPVFNKQIQSMEKLLDVVKDSPILFAKMKGSIDQANATGTLDGIFQELLQIKDAAQVTTGPLGRIAQFINEKSGGKFFKDATKEAREFAIVLEHEAISKLKELGGGDLLGPIEALTARFRDLQDGFIAIGNAIQATRRGIAVVSEAFLKFTGLKAPVDALVNAFDTLASGLVIKLRTGFETVKSDVTSIFSSLGIIITGKLDQALAPLAGAVGRTLGGLKKTFNDFFTGLAGTGVGKVLIDKFNAIKTKIQNKFGAELGPPDGRPILGPSEPKPVFGPPAPKPRPILGPPVPTKAGLGVVPPPDTSEIVKVLGAAGTVAGKLFFDNFSREIAGLPKLFTLPTLVEPPAAKSAVESFINLLKSVIDEITALPKSVTLPQVDGPSRGGAQLQKARDSFEAARPKTLSDLGAKTASSGSNGQAVGMGKDIISGLSAGIAANKAALVTALTGVKNTVIGGIKALFQIASASKVMIPFGKNIVLGVVEGIKGAAGLVGKALGALTDGLGALAGSAAAFAKSAVTVASVALAGLGAVSLKTGLDFNVLQQVINSSLPVLVGSKKASADLLEQVNLLNDSSPYARSAFLELTRVLAGFGVQAAKITPLIDAIQQTVAATGGSDQDLLELGQAFAKIQTEGRLSGDVLQSFSVRGVDAIAVLGQQFGKTQIEIKDMIANGLIPADKAIDGLTKGLKAKFDGATDAVSKNFPGALQRVQARLRDIGGTILKAFVNPAGGGALVTFLNKMADSLSHINKVLLPAFAPALQKVADALVFVSNKIAIFVTSFDKLDASKFVASLGPVLPLLAAFVGFLPGLLGFLPVIGPMLAALGGPFTALAAGLAVAAVQSGNFGSIMKSVADTLGGVFTFIKEHVNGVIGVLVGLLHFAPKVGGAIGGLAASGGAVGGIFAKFSGILTTVASKFPLLAGGLEILTGPVGIVVGLIAQLVITSSGFREALVNLFHAVMPVAKLIGGVLAVGVEILDGALKALTPIFIFMVDLWAAWFRSMNPVIDAVQKFIKAVKDSGVIEKVFKAIADAVQWVIDMIKKFIDLYNKIPFLPNIELEVKVKIDSVKKATEDTKKQLEDQQKAAKDSAAAIEDNFKAAGKAVETANAAMSASIDTLKQAISTAAGIINGIIDAAKAVKTANEAVVAANAAVTAARTKAAESAANLIKINIDYARALQDVISPLNEVAVAERNLTRIRNGLRDLDRDIISTGKENVKLLKEIADLEGQQGADDKAATIRGVERAQIALNRATQAELDLQNELNGANKIDIDLSGLTLDQIRAKLAAVRATAAARGKERDKTDQEKSDELATARLDVADAKQGLVDATKTRDEFDATLSEHILDIRTQIGLNDEHILDLQADRLDKLLDEQSAVKGITHLLEGETTQQGIILDFDGRIKAAKDQILTDAKGIETASMGVRTALEGAAIASATLKLKIAEARGDTDGMLQAQKDLWALQAGDLFSSNSALRGIYQEQLTLIEKQKEASKETVDNVAAAVKLLGGATALTGLNSTLTSAETFTQKMDSGFLPENALNLKKLGEGNVAVANSVRLALSSGVTFGKDGNLKPLTPSQIEEIVRAVLDAPTANIRNVLNAALIRFGVSVPGFSTGGWATGYAPGDLLHRGMNDGVGIARLFEYGKEAVLPLTRRFDMARIVNNPTVLPAILDALPRWSRPEAAVDSGNTNLSTIVERSARMNGGPANDDVYQKKAQRDLASTIGDAVKIAVKEALAESETLGADVDINVLPSTGNERLIAREVKRQVDKALGKW